MGDKSGLERNNKYKKGSFHLIQGIGKLLVTGVAEFFFPVLILFGSPSCPRTQNMVLRPRAFVQGINLGC